MLPRTVRGAVAAAAVVVEEVGKRVVDTAAAILERTGVDVAEVERRLGGQFPPSAQTLQTLAEEAVTAGRAGVDLAVGVARNEVEKAFEKVGDQVTKVGVVLAYLESKLREVEEEPVVAGSAAEPYPGEEPVPAPRAGDLFGRGWEFEDERVAAEPVVAERVEVDEPVEFDPPVSPVSPVPPVAVVEPAVNGTTARKSAPRKTAPKKSAPRKSVPKKAATDKAGTDKPATEKATGKKAAAKKTTVAKKSSARKTAQRKPNGAEPTAAAKRTATKKTTVRKATSTRATATGEPDVRDE
ncbi:hypothetical protein [Kitasatospora sp. NPDC089509]|uniref:hypothetical protein n=1 Tax=Kitasatospora sp. NPDC089509 TaxID=3364079 RepID=UPI0038192439